MSYIPEPMADVSATPDSRRVILFAEDNPVSRKYVTITLETTFPNHQIVTIESLADAHTLCPSVVKRMDLLLTDGGLPDGCGWHVAEMLEKKGYQGPKVYGGNTPLPDEHRPRFNAVTDYKFNPDWLDIVTKQVTKADIKYS